MEKACSKALKDIKAGEEITEDYSGYLTNKSDWAYKLMQQYKPERWELEEIILKRKNIGK